MKNAIFHTRRLSGASFVSFGRPNSPQRLIITYCLWLFFSIAAAFSQTTIFSESFDGAFPGGWSVGDSNAAGTTAYWKNVNLSTFGTPPAHGTGTYAGYCAGTGFAGTTGSPKYQNSMTAYMSRSIDLTGYASASLTFWYIIPSIEAGSFDKCRVYIDNDLIFERTVTVTTWTQKSPADLSAYLGGIHTLKFEFVSDNATTAEGWYVDDIQVTGTLLGTIDARLRKLDGTNASPNTARMRLYTSPTRDITGSNPALFTSVPSGTYLLEGYQTGTFLGEEFWGNASATATAGATSLFYVDRTFPYVSGVVLKYHSDGTVIPVGATIPYGTTVRAEITVQNLTSQNLQVQARVLYDRYQSTTAFDYDSGYSSLQNIGSNSTRTYSLPIQMVADGQFYRALAVKTVADTVSGIAVLTDSWSWSSHFTVSPQVVTAPTLIGPGGISAPGTSLTDSNAIFSWNAVSGATDYTMTLRDTTAGSDVGNFSTGATTAMHLPANVLTVGHQYEWHARATVGGIQSANSASLYFTYTSANPTARPDMTNRAPEVLRSVSFDGTNSTAVAPKTLVSWSWQFSDGALYTGSSFQRTFQSSDIGARSVTLTVTDSVGLTDIKTMSFVVGGGLGTNGTSKSSIGVDPVNLATGNYLYNHPCIRIPGRGMDFAFSIFYNSKAFDSANPSATNGPLGQGWEHTFTIRIQNANAAATEPRIVVYPDGHRSAFIPAGTGFAPQVGVYDILANNLGGGYTLTSKSQIRQIFDASGKLIEIRDRNDNVITVNYTDPAYPNRVDSVTDTTGRLVDFQYDASGHLWKLVDVASRVFEFTVDANSDLVAFKDRRGKATTFAYDALHQMTEGQDSKGQKFVQNTYDAMQRVVSTQKDAKQGQTTISYDFSTHITTVTDPLIQVTQHKHDADLNVVEIDYPVAGISEKFGYDQKHNRILVTDKRGNSTGYDYDLMGNVTKKTDAKGGVTTIIYNSRNDPELREDPMHRLTKWEYDGAGNLIAQTSPFLPAQPTRYRRTFAMNGIGQVTQKTDARGNPTTFGYDANGYVNSVTNAKTETTTAVFDNIGRKSSETNARLKTTQFTWDEEDHPLTTIFPGTTPVAERTITRAYDDNGNPASITDQKGRTTQFFYDEKDLLYRTLFPDGTDEVTDFDALDRKQKFKDRRGYFTRWFYNGLGYVTKVRDQNLHDTLLLPDPNGNVLEVTDADGFKTTSVFDELNRVTSVKDNDGHETKTEYDAVGAVTKVTDPKARATIFQRDGNTGQLVKTTSPPAVAADPTSVSEVFYAYDDEGNRTSVTDPDGVVTTYAIDQLNRVTEERTPTGGGNPDRVVAYTFDAVGNPATVTNSHGTATRTYDDQNRLANIAYPNAPPVSFTYDAVGSRLTMTDGIGTTTWTVDPLTDRPSTVTDPFGKTLEFTHDPNGNRTSIKYPGNKLVSYTFDPANRLTRMVDWLGHTVTQSQSDAGRIQSIANPNGTTTTIGYDTAGRLNNIQHAKGTAAPFESLPYALNEAGDITSIPDRSHIPSHELPRTDTYTYDQAGQIKTLNGTPFTHNPDGAITQGPLTRTSLGNDALTYDFESRIVAANIGASQITSRYNGFGHRLEMTRNGAATRFVVDGTGPLAQILAETDSTGTITAYYLYFGGLSARVAADGTITYYHGDRNGNTIALTNGNGDVTDTYAYDEFGFPVATVGLTPNPFRALGRHGVYDNSDGTLFIRARNYHPDLGRFLSKDLYAGNDNNTQSVNRYVYALNNPVRMVDVSGFFAREGAYANSTVAYLTHTDSMHGDAFWSVFWPTFGKELAGRLTLIGVSFIPGVGEGMDVQTIADPNAGYFSKGFAGLSLVLSGASDGFTPNFGSFRRAFSTERRVTSDFISTPNGLVDVRNTVKRIESGEILQFRHDGTVFNNREQLLPNQAEGYYKEFVHPTPGLSGPGAQRIISGGNGELYFTPDHYETFIPIN